MELKQLLNAQQLCDLVVLIVPFMELKRGCSSSQEGALQS